MCATSCDNALLNDNDEGLPPASTLATPDALTRLCGEHDPQRGIAELVVEVNRLMPALQFKHVLSRGGWHRLGGVVDRDYRRVAGNIVHWVEHECGGDVDGLVARYVGSGFFATRLIGSTHYLTAARSDSPHDFVQIEIEELQEALDRPLVDRDWYPDSVEEFLEPIDYPRVEPEPVAPAHFQFRRITAIGDLIGSAKFSRQIGDLCRFFADWSVSSAGEHANFCDHWVLSLREYRDREGLQQLTAKPVATFSGEPPELPRSEGVRGAALANAIHAYDRSMGYPFAWYFMMLGQKAGNYALADAVLADQMGAYEYLCARDLRVLRDWEERPYGV